MRLRCGGGQIVLGSAGAALAIVILTGVRYAEERMKQDRQGHLLIVMNDSGPDEPRLLSLLHANGFRASSFSYDADESDQQKWTCELRWRATLTDVRVPAPIRELRATKGVIRISWIPQAR